MTRNILTYSAFALLVVIGHLLSNVLAMDAAAVTAGLTCAGDAVSLRCAFGEDATYSPAAYAGLATFLAGALVFAGVKRRHSVILPFAMLFGGLGLFALAYDLFARASVIGHAAMVNGAFNALALGLVASLLLVPLLLVRTGLSFLRLSAAAIVTFAGKIAALALLALVEPLFRGAVEMWFLYFVFLFGAFSAHIGALAFAIAGADAAAPAALPELRASNAN